LPQLGCSSGRQYGGNIRMWHCSPVPVTSGMQSS
jgi:hypothetical protein